MSHFTVLVIGENPEEQLRQHLEAGRKRSTFRYNPTAAHRAIVAALGSHAITDEEAMGLLHEYEVFAERTGKETTR